MNSNKYTVDRFEGDLAVLLQKADESVELNALKDSLPKDVSEGDLLEITFTDDGAISTVTILEEETNEIKETVSNLIEKLKNK